MKKIFILFLLIAIGGMGAFAKSIKKIVPIDLTVQKEKEKVVVSFKIQANAVRLPSKNYKLILTPILYKGEDEQLLKPIVFDTRRTRIMEERNGIPPMENSYIAPNKEEICYTVEIPYQPWMDDSSVKLEQLLTGCCTEKSLTTLLEGTYKLIAAQPPLPDTQVEAKQPFIRYEFGTANVEFPQGRFILLEDFRNNRAELQKIRNSIEKVRNEKGAVITGIEIQGSCSPEAPWAYNTKLAAERTKVVKNYINTRYGVDPNLIKDSSVPEDWDRFKQLIELSDIAEKDKILAVINSNETPDEKDMELSKIPIYGYLLRNIYPQLRHVDYKIQYIIEDPNSDESR